MEAYQQRVVKEAADLEVKLDGLEKFINNHNVFRTINVAEQTRLIRQRDAMRLYLKVLQERVENF